MTGWIARLVAQGGPWGVCLLMLLENVVPPIPSELIMPLAGFASAQGRMSAVGAVVGGTAGSVAGAWVWYELGRRFGHARLERWLELNGRWLAVTPEEYRRAARWMERHGPWMLAVGRCLPGIRGVVCIPAGVVGMRRATFAFACTAGSLLWCFLLVAAGRALGSHYEAVEGWLEPVSSGFFSACLLVYVSRVIWPRQADAVREGDSMPRAAVA